MKKVLLVTPPYHAGVVESAGTWLPLSFVYLAGSLRKAGFDPEIYDAMSRFHTHEDIRKEISARRPDVVASTAITGSVMDAIELLKKAKEANPGVTTVLGGVHPTFMWREILNEHGEAVDYIVRGEGEDVFPELLECHFSGQGMRKVRGIAYRENGRPAATPSRPFTKDLDSLSPAWDLLEWGMYSYRPSPGSTLAVVGSSRGCQKHCSFCSQQLFWQQIWRGRSPESFVDELECLRERYNVTVAMICDETPTTDRERWGKILDLLIERRLGMDLLMETRVDDILRDEALLGKYREAGISHIYAGVEAGSQQALDMFEKDTKVEQGRTAIDLINAHDIVSETSFVLGMPQETPESIKATVDLAVHYDPDMAFFLAIAPWPYADIYSALEPFIVTKDYRKYNLVEPVVKPERMSIEEMREALFAASRDFFMDKFKRLSSLSSFKQDYMVRVLDLLIKHSYLGEKMASLRAQGAEMPEGVRKVLEAAGMSFGGQLT